MRIDDAFIAAVLACVRSTTPGDVLTYGEIATEIGHRGQARAVGRVLSAGHPDVPWWRVVNGAGRLVPGHEAEQRRRLAAEGVAVDERRVLGLRRR